MKLEQILNFLHHIFDKKISFMLAFVISTILLPFIIPYSSIFLNKYHEIISVKESNFLLFIVLFFSLFLIIQLL